MSDSNTTEAVIIEDLKNDLVNNKTEVSGDNEGEKGAITPEVVPSFLPLPLIKYTVVGKNSLIVHFLAKNIPSSSHSLLQDHYKPTEEEFDLYRKFLESLIWKHFRQVAEWFMKNDSVTVMGEIMLFETVRVMPMLSIMKTEDKKEPKEDVSNGT